MLLDLFWWVLDLNSMRIGIDISQLAYPNTGVANYLQNLVEHVLAQKSEHEFVLFFSSMRGRLPDSKLWQTSPFLKIDETSVGAKSVTIKQMKFPPSLLDIIWNRLHIFPIETFIGDVDVFISSDWVEPPSKAKKMTVLYDLIVYKYPEETAQKIINTQKRKLKWVKKECDKILCISDATKKDAENIFNIDPKKLAVIYPGL